MMNRMLKVGCVVMSVMLVGSAGFAQHYRGDHHRHSYHGYTDCGKRYGYYHNSRGELVFGLVGLMAGAAIVSAINQPDTVVVRERVYVQPEPRVIYVQQPAVIPPPQIVYVPQPQVVKEPEPKIVYVPQPVQIEQPQPPAAPKPASPPTSQPQAAPQAATVTINVQNTDGSFSSVTLRQEGARWIGPHGESYPEVPSIGQLRPLYGR